MIGAGGVGPSIQNPKSSSARSFSLAEVGRHGGGGRMLGES